MRSLKANQWRTLPAHTEHFLVDYLLRSPPIQIILQTYEPMVEQTRSGENVQITENWVSAGKW